MLATNEKTIIVTRVNRTPQPTYELAVRWVAENDMGPRSTSREELDVDAVYSLRTVAMISTLFNIDRRIVASDVVRMRTKMYTVDAQKKR